MAANLACLNGQSICRAINQVTHIRSERRVLDKLFADLRDAGHHAESLSSTVSMRRSTHGQDHVGAVAALEKITQHFDGMAQTNETCLLCLA